MRMTTTHTRTPMALLLAALIAAPLAFAGEHTTAKFSKFDSDGNGNVTSTEHADAARAMFAEMDADGDQRVTAAEMKAFRDQSGPPDADELSAEAKISQVDDNRDGVLSASEHEAASRAKFAEMDNNNDGALSQAEFDLGHESLKHG